MAYGVFLVESGGHMFRMQETGINGEKKPRNIFLESPTHITLITRIQEKGRRSHNYLGVSDLCSRAP